MLGAGLGGGGLMGYCVHTSIRSSPRLPRASWLFLLRCFILFHLVVFFFVFVTVVVDDAPTALSSLHSLHSLLVPAR